MSGGWSGKFYSYSVINADVFSNMGIFRDFQSDRDKPLQVSCYYFYLFTGLFFLI